MGTLKLNTSTGGYLIDTGIIVRVEASSNYSKLYFNDGKMMVTAKLLRWFEEKLEPGSFTRLHRSHLINNRYLLLHQITNKSIELQNGKIIPVSRRRKKTVLQKLAAACVLLFFFSYASLAQNVGVGTNTPHASAVLDVVSNNTGLAIPSLTTAQRNAIVTPKAGLFVFDTNMQTLCMFNGTNWVYFQSSIEPNIVHPVEQVASDGEIGDEFGYSVAISGNYAVIGAPYDNIGTNSNQGSAYIFFFNGTGWVEQAKLLAADGSANDHFGFSVSISGDYAIVGAPDDDLGAFGNVGRAYIFIRSGTNWTQQANFTGASAFIDDNFGYSVSIDGAYAAIGARGDDVGANAGQGTAYVFIRSGVNWSQQDYVTLPSGATGDAFGSSVSISGVHLIVGAPNDDISGEADAGSTHVFQRNGVTWSHNQVLTYNFGGTDFHFGYSVSVSGNYMVAGAPAETISSSPGGGRAYIFDGTSWATTDFGSLLISLPGINGDPNSGDRWGYSLSAGGSNIVVGAPNRDTLGFNSGMAYLIQTDGTQFYFVRHIIDPIGGANHLMGFSTAVSPAFCVTGSPYANGQKGKILFLRL